jgi:hypothetical protein
VSVDLLPGESTNTTVTLQNTFNETREFTLVPDSEIAPYVSVSDKTVELEPGDSTEVTVSVVTFRSTVPGLRSGTIDIVTDDKVSELPAKIRVLRPIDEAISTSTSLIGSDTVQRGSTASLRIETSGSQLPTPVNLTHEISVVPIGTNETAYRTNTTVVMDKEVNTVAVDIDLPDSVEPGSYKIETRTTYSNTDGNQSVFDATGLTVEQAFLDQSLFGVSYRALLLGVLVLVTGSGLGYGWYVYKRRQRQAEKRYTDDFDMDKLPSEGERSAYVGKLAERDEDAYIDLDDLTTHAMIAGATGSGKSVTAQAVAEEALAAGVNVIVLDPTGQWSGYLNECEDEGMMELYDEFDYTEDDARAFNGNIRAVDPGAEVDITPYLESEDDEEEGQIIVFSLHKLENANIDKFVDATVRQIFQANCSEKNQLDTLMVYDETHRLLPEFGGDGEGLKQVERGAREFRKWGIGMMLVSQVVSDFPEEVRSNIGTTIQMRTQYEGDLERLTGRYGKETMQGIVKAEVGTGLIQNSSYNNGNPYFVNWRPLLHSPKRLSDDDLEMYENYNKRIDKLDEVIAEMPEDEAFEYQTEMELIKNNLQKGSFNLAEIYLDELEEKLLDPADS